jgi:hypothetical protein
VAYLSFSDFETQISKNVRVESLVPHTWAASNPLAFVGDFMKLAISLWAFTLFGRHEIALPDINLLEYAKSNLPPSNDLQKKYKLLRYCIDNWTHHTRDFSPEATSLWELFGQLALEKHSLFDFRPWND